MVDVKEEQCLGFLNIKIKIKRKRKRRKSNDETNTAWKILETEPNLQP